jgi:hypothetical protein
MTDAGLSEVAQIEALTALILNGCLSNVPLLTLGLGNLTDSVTDASLHYLSSMISLTSLDLSFGTAFTDNALQGLSNLHALTTLSLEECVYITDAAL